ncbi:MAG: hypothetical protein JW924_14705 [Fusobacteriaceae bacterium]|nr:hypothetical protein [Fusobacteriaceae bacterium]
MEKELEKILSYLPDDWPELKEIAESDLARFMTVKFECINMIKIMRRNSDHYKEKEGYQDHVKVLKQAAEIIEDPDMKGYLLAYVEDDMEKAREHNFNIQMRLKDEINKYNLWRMVE